MERFCQQCGYNLAGLAEHRCPECGRAFDPVNERTTDRVANERRHWRRINTAFLVMATYPVVCVIVLYLTWGVIGYLTLGRLPRPMHDDPKGIKGAMVIANLIMDLLLTLGPAIFALDAVLLSVCVIWTALKRRGRLRVAIGFTGLSGFTWVGSVLFLRWDPLRALFWFMD